MKLIVISLFLVTAVLSSPPEGRITNGSTATSGQFPYQVGLWLHVNATSSSWCGGSLIGPRWVLTAAHCTNSIQAVTVFLGATNRTTAEAIYTIYNNNIIVHSNYNAKTFRDDISLIRIPPTTYTPRIQPIKLPATPTEDTPTTYIGEWGIASGWGRPSDKVNTVAEQLQWARLEIVSNDQCSFVYGRSMIYPTNICTATVGGTSTCSGDSGGPLVLETTGVQIGLVSFGATAGCEKGYPIAFTRLSNYLKWIEINIS